MLTSAHFRKFQAWGPAYENSCRL